MEEGMKQCSRCGEIKPRNQFYPSRIGDRRTSKCIDCYLEEKEGKVVQASIPSDWAKNKKTICTHTTSKCWLNYQKALCCIECAGFNECKLPDRCMNHPSKCKK